MFVTSFSDIYQNLMRKNFIKPSFPEHPKVINWNKKFVSVSPLIPLGWQGLQLPFAKLLTYAISVSLTIEIHKNNIDTFRVTNKQYYKIILFLKFLSKLNWHFQEVTDKYYELFPEKLYQTIILLIITLGCELTL